jgi:hypothetical protein
MHGRNHRPKGWYGPDDPGGSDPLNWLDRDRGLLPHHDVIASIPDLRFFYKLNEAPLTDPIIDYGPHLYHLDVSDGTEEDLAYRRPFPPISNFGVGFDYQVSVIFNSGHDNGKGPYLVRNVTGFWTGASDPFTVSTWLHTKDNPLLASGDNVLDLRLGIVCAISEMSSSRSGWGLGMVVREAAAPANHRKLVWERGNSPLLWTPTAPAVGFHHVVVRCDGATQELLLDGQIVASGSIGTSGMNMNRIMLGKESGTVGRVDERHWYGDLAAAAGWDRRLTDAEVARLAFGSGVSGMRIVSDDYEVEATDVYVLASGTITVTLPASNTAGMLGRVVTVKNVGTGTVTVEPTGAETIDGASSVSLATANQARAFLATGTGWLITGGYL